MIWIDEVVIKVFIDVYGWAVECLLYFTFGNEWSSSVGRKEGYNCCECNPAQLGITGHESMIQ